MKYRELVKKVQRYSWLSDAESRQALEHTVESLAGQLSQRGRCDFARHLPPELQYVALSVTLCDKPIRKDILRYFREKYGLDETHAKKQLIASWYALKGVVMQEEVKDISTQLPHSTMAILQ